MESPQPIIRENRYGPGGMLKFLKNHLFDYIILLLISGAIVAADQWTKALVRANIPLGTDWLPKGMMWLMPFARIRHWYNSGAAFGIFRNGNMVFTILAIIIILLILFYFPRTERNDWWLRVAMSLQLAGAAGNLLDRLAFTHVTDFISVGNFAIFNVADASISTGVVVLLFGVWLKERAEKRQAARITAPETGQNVPTKDEAKRG
jgi:signal peptidase II